MNADGNETSGVPSVLHQAPLGTYLGWNVTRSGFYAGQGADSRAGTCPLPRRARSETRPGIRERHSKNATAPPGRGWQVVTSWMTDSMADTDRMRRAPLGAFVSWWVGLALVAATAATPGAAPVGAPCASLTSLTITSVRIESATDVAAGPLALGGSRAEPLDLPAHCRVVAVATPVPDSRIGIEIWIPPTAAWNGKLLGTGNGGFSSAMAFPAMADGLKRGYAVVATDTGHTGDSMEFGVGHPEKIVDWAYRAVHVMTDVAKMVVRNQHGRFPARSYFSGCSTGGQQALSEAQRYPSDYDGIIAGNPAINRLHLIYAFLRTWLAARSDDDRLILPSSKLPALAAAVMKACDGRDGLEDGLIGDPRLCRFDPATLACRGADSDACLTPPQVQVVKKIYEATRHARTEAELFPGWAYGSELGWRGYITDAKEPARLGLFTGWAFHNPQWSPRSFDFDRDVDHIDGALPFVNATSVDLRAFRKRGGKIIMYTGLADAVVPPQDTVNYYERVAAADGGMAATRHYFRFFPAPGMGHCGGGAAPNRFDTLTPLEAWVERGRAPQRIIATEQQGPTVIRTRPLCVYPSQARYKGTGSIDDAARFVCQ